MERPTDKLLKKVPVIAPIIVSLTGVIPFGIIELIKKTIKAPKAEPINENTINKIFEDAGKSIIQRVTKKVEPSSIPNIDGEAIIFLVIPCIIDPEIAKKAPIIREPIILGTLEYIII
jgi:hypothetical protein